MACLLQHASRLLTGSQENARLSCQLLVEWPFDTAAITNSDLASYFASDHPIQTLLSHLQGWEKNHLKDHSQEGRRLAALLRYQDSSRGALSSHADAILPPPDPHPSTYETLVALLSAYKVVDLMAASQVRLVPSQLACPKTLRPELVPREKFFEKLADYPSILRACRGMLTSASVEIPALEIRTPHIHLHHLRHMGLMEKKNGVAPIIDNFRSAAMHLAFMLQMPATAVDSLPDLPSKLTNLLCFVTPANSTNTEGTPPLTENEMMALLALLQQSTATHLRLPLQLALLISPLYLLLPYYLRKKSWGRENLARLAQALGNIRPFVLRRLEQDIWAALFNVLNGKNIIECLLNLTKTASWQEVEALSSSDPAFSFFHVVSPRPMLLINRAPGEDFLVAAACPPFTHGPGHAPLGDGDHDTSSSLNVFRPRDVEAGEEDEDRHHMNDLTNNAAMADGDSGEVERNSIESDANEPDVIQSNSNEPDSNAANGLKPAKGTKEATRSSSRIKELLSVVGKKATPGPPLAPKKRRRVGKKQAKLPISVEDSDEEDDDDDDQRPRKKGKAAAVDRETLEPNTSEKTWYWEPINVDVFGGPDRITLTTGKRLQHYQWSRDVVAYGPKGERHVFRPKVQSELALRRIIRVICALERGYQHGLPLHLADEQNSGIKIVAEENFLPMSDCEVQGVLATQHIVITDIKPPQVSFKDALRDCVSLNSVISIQDQSLPLKKKDNPDSIIRKGTLRQLLQCSELPGSEILNALNLPLPLAPMERTTFASEMHALFATLNAAGWKAGMSTHNAQFRWALASTKGAFHNFHIDSDGLGTFLDPILGAKWWIMARPKPGYEATVDFSNINTFLKDCFSMDKVPEGWLLEAVVVVPGMKLIMRPNTPHAVITLQHSVFWGGHFYGISTIRDTFYGLLHCFVAENFISNTAHGSSRFLLRQLLAFSHMALVENAVDIDDDRKWSHIPDVESIEGLKEFFTLCIFGLLCSVLDFETYCYPGQTREEELNSEQKKLLVAHDFNDMSIMNRIACARTRGLAVDLLSWFKHEYDIHSAVVEPPNLHPKVDLDTLFRAMLCQTCSALLLYKMKAIEDGIEGAPHCTLDLIEMQLLGIFPSDHFLQVGIIEAVHFRRLKKDKLADSFSLDVLFGPMGDFFVQPKPQAAIYESIDILDSGISLRDELYMHHMQLNYVDISVKQEDPDEDTNIEYQGIREGEGDDDDGLEVIEVNYDGADSSTESEDDT